MSDVARQVFVCGRVQGVAFRFHTRERALQLGLAGWVRNLSDGRVEVRCQGDAAAVDELLSWLRQGPRWARVDDLDVSSPAVDVSCTDFVVEP